MEKKIRVCDGCGREMEKAELGVYTCAACGKELCAECAVFVYGGGKHCTLST